MYLTHHNILALRNHLDGNLRTLTLDVLGAAPKTWVGEPEFDFGRSKSYYDGHLEQKWQVLNLHDILKSDWDTDGNNGILTVWVFVPMSLIENTNIGDKELLNCGLNARQTIQKEKESQETWNIAGLRSHWKMKQYMKIFVPRYISFIWK